MRSANYRRGSRETHGPLPLLRGKRKRVPGLMEPVDIFTRALIAVVNTSLEVFKRPRARHVIFIRGAN